jgi:hypothetical protein
VLLSGSRHDPQESYARAHRDFAGHRRAGEICVRQPDGAIVEERKVPTRKLIEVFATWPASRVVMGQFGSELTDPDHV